MNMVWVIVGLGIVGAIIALATSWHQFDSHADLGAVSHHWIAEQRMGPGSDSRR